MFKRLLIVGLLAGSLSGSLLTTFHLFTVIPLIHQAEQFENQLPPSQADHTSHSQGSPEWEPEDGWERLGFTWLSNLVIASGFGMMMAGMMSLRRPQNWSQAALFGLAGFYCFFLAPASILPPELPGSLAAGLLLRQGIWLYTVAASILSLALLIFTNRSSIRVLALMVLVSPFFLFTPEDVHYLAAVPQQLIEQFTWMTAVTTAALWLSLAWSTFYLIRIV